MPSGTVKWFDREKGFGFVVVDDTADELFVHYRDIAMDGFRVLAEGQRVDFVVGDGDRPQAREVVPGEPRR
ncbi:cold-shock protein [Agrococcus versicolor]|uniref:Cold-shock protein n=1 Tax=Agrococcus versicolor TaxID=501482 RepID=A0ABN3ASW0_9MICO